MVKVLDNFKSQSFETPDEALDAVMAIYDQQLSFLREAFKDFVKNGSKVASGGRIRAFYPYARVFTRLARRSDTRLSYGFAPRPGTYSTTLTRPDIFRKYYHEQFRLLIKNHDVPIEVGVSETPIPIHFALGESFHLEGDLTGDQLKDLPDIFDVPNLDIMDDEIANSTYVPGPGQDEPLSLFTAPRVDLSLQRLKHYCGMPAEFFQHYIIFTNYQFYIDEFIKIGRKKAGKDGYTRFEGPDPKGRLPQMPAYHLMREDGKGITMVNIGVGPSNAKTITDHIAVLRPHAWLMLGHCAGLRNSQQLGDYVLAHGYLREDHVLDDHLPLSIPIPALAEIQMALESAVEEVTGEAGYDLKKVMRTGTVATTDDRNWELCSAVQQNQRLSQSRAIAMDMESGTIAANGFRFRVPYGTLLCVSDKPLHGQLKLPGMADTFYRERIDQHLLIGIRTMEKLREYSPEKLHSRKLRSFNEAAFQ
ncbi:MAG: AMP nucleosidase [Alphaproteobacteria bacterium]|nr:AMP nucleosidase [Alphaproteobacteria bacterium]